MPPATFNLGIVVGFDQEAMLVSRWGRVAIGGGGYDGAVKAAETLVELGCTALISYGIAGGLDPALPAGTLLVAAEVLIDGQTIRANLIPPGLKQVRMLGARDIVATVAAKAALWEQTGAACVDIETGAVALVARRHRLPFGALRAICDPAQHVLPPAAMNALDNGSIRFGRVLLSLLRAPWQLSALISLARDAKAARAALMSVELEGLGDRQQGKAKGSAPVLGKRGPR